VPATEDCRQLAASDWRKKWNPTRRSTYHSQYS